jgi:hypothetical protein
MHVGRLSLREFGTLAIPKAEQARLVRGTTPGARLNSGQTGGCLNLEGREPTRAYLTSGARHVAVNSAAKPSACATAILTVVSGVSSVGGERRPGVGTEAMLWLVGW